MAAKPFKADGGAQMATGAPSWQGPNGVGGIYHKAGVGVVARRTDDREIVLNSPSPLYVNTTPVASVTSGERDAHVYTMPANTLAVDGQRLEITFASIHGANTNTATYRVYIAGTAIVVRARAIAAETGMVNVAATRTAGFIRWRSQGIDGATSFGGAGAVAADFTIAVVIKSTVEGPTLVSDMTAQLLRVEIWP